MPNTSVADSRLLGAVRRMCTRLAEHGWRDVLLVHGLDIAASDLRTELLRDLPGVDRAYPGFEDFTRAGHRGIEPGVPARSLLYHAMASPAVAARSDGLPLTGFPTAAELDQLENLVFGVIPPTLDEVRRRAGASPLVIAVFASEYRLAADTVHRRHADLCFARTGVARVGTREPLYAGRARAFTPVVDGDAHAIRVLPCRYSAYLAVSLSGDPSSFGPMRFQPPSADGAPGDAARPFWVPVHKLFDGGECIRGRDLRVALRHRHVNDKIARVIRATQKAADRVPKWFEFRLPEVLDGPPFTVSEGLVELAGAAAPAAGDQDCPPGTLIPRVHPDLAAPAVYEDTEVTLAVPPGRANLPVRGGGESTMVLGDPSAPEYAYVRERVDPPADPTAGSAGTRTDLSNDPAMLAILGAGDFEAVAYADHTADGWVAARCPQLTLDVPSDVPAYSVLAPPDFYPAVGQRQLSEWVHAALPPSEVAEVFTERPVIPLSDVRLPANLELPGAPFDESDVTVTAVVCLTRQGGDDDPITAVAGARHGAWGASSLPDAAAGESTPGWDVGVGGAPVRHLASYRLASPFLEDVKICAAVGSYWPGVAPDALRAYRPSITPFRRTQFPLTDEELGAGAPAWDGHPGPRLVDIPGEENQYVEHLRAEFADLVGRATGRPLSLALTARVGFDEFRYRLLAMRRVNRIAENDPWIGRFVLSFRRVTADDPECRAAQQESGAALEDNLFLYRVEMYGARRERDAGDFRRVLVEAINRVTVFVDPVTALLRRAGRWQVAAE
ncbi:MAG TPA: hypothetical protein VEA69_03850 [Tepidisphaeraceae bacterium]|nr:hypothetical protein [Tepidisphaeraceae bacterium]